ncbi:MAG: UDP-N-acetylmuramate dehydrogenase [Lachnospiraceae bacterium]|jgi:UDP-N-acetylmuramate dehydrogenase|nr:UDP-N-acetylmuramate dehydrogenase [Lachnospiraceae bacterium]
MIKATVLDEIKQVVSAVDILSNEPMSRHTTFKVGGAAELFIRLRGTEQLQFLIPLLQEAGIDYFLLGNGSNLLVGDKGYRGVILHSGNKMAKINGKKEQITAEAGATLANVARYAAENGLSGLEFASGIPGTVGGAAVMNAGAFAGEMATIIESVQAVDTDGNLVRLPREVLAYGYRQSIFMEYSYAISSVTMRLQYDDTEEIKHKMADFATRRSERQPLEYASAGSTFKRPKQGYAGEMIMESGMGGFSIGGASVSEKHCGFVINRGNATAADIRAVIKEVEERVVAKYNVILKPEVIFLGDF